MVAIDNTTVVFYILSTREGETVPLPSSSSSGPIAVASVTRHSSLGQTHSRLPNCDDRLPVQAQLSSNHKMVSPS